MLNTFQRTIIGRKLTQSSNKLTDCDCDNVLVSQRMLSLISQYIYIIISSHKMLFNRQYIHMIDAKYQSFILAMPLKCRIENGGIIMVR